MPQTVTPVANTWPSSFTAHADGDLVNGADSLAELQDYANAHKFVRDRAQEVKIGYSRLVPLSGLSPFNFAYVNTGTDGPGSNADGWRQTGTGGFLTFPLPMIEGNTFAKLTSLVCFFHPKIAGRAGLPTTQPSVKIWRQIGDLSAGRLQVGTTSTLASGSVVAYEAPQLLTIVIGGGHVIDNSYHYTAEFRGEADAGANFAAGLMLGLMRITTDAA